MALYFNNNVPGVHVPQPILNIMEKGNRDTGLAIAKDLVNSLRDIHSDGAHIMPVNDIDAVPYIIG